MARNASCSSLLISSSTVARNCWYFSGRASMRLSRRAAWVAPPARRRISARMPSAARLGRRLVRWRAGAPRLEGRATIESLYYGVSGPIPPAALRSRARDARLPGPQRHHPARSTRARGHAAVAGRTLGQPVLDPRARAGGARGDRGGDGRGWLRCSAGTPKKSSSSPRAPRPTTRCCAAWRGTAAVAGIS